MTLAPIPECQLEMLSREAALVCDASGTITWADKRSSSWTSCSWT
jgi:hypothetical protein